MINNEEAMILNLKEIEDGICDLLSPLSLKNVKVSIKPNDPRVKTTCTISVQYIGETAESPTNSKMRYQGVCMAYNSTVSYRIRALFRELRSKHLFYTDIIEDIFGLLSGQRPVKNDQSVGPLIFESISFVEKNSDEFFIYDVNYKILVTRNSRHDYKSWYCNKYSSSGTHEC